MSAHERERLNALCSRRGLALIVDEVFLDYTLNGTAQPSFATNRDVLTFTLSGISKLSALPQMKLAWVGVSGPQSMTDAAIQRLELIADTYLSMNAPIQLAAPVLLAQHKSIQAQVMDRVRANLSDLDQQLANQKSCSRLEVEGGWYAIIRIPVTRPDEDFAIDLLRSRSVLVHPGHFYDFPNDGYLVVSLITAAHDFRVAIRSVLEIANQ